MHCCLQCIIDRWMHAEFAETERTVYRLTLCSAGYVS